MKWRDDFWTILSPNHFLGALITTCMWLGLRAYSQPADDPLHIFPTQILVPSIYLSAHHRGTHAFEVPAH